MELLYADWQTLRRLASEGNKEAEKIYNHRALLAAKIEGIIHHEDPLGLASLKTDEYKGYGDDISERLSTYRRTANEYNIPLSLIKIEVGNSLHMVEPENAPLVNRIALSISYLV